MASKTVAFLLNISFSIPPVPIRQIRVQQNKAKNNFPTKETIHPKNIIKVYEVWRCTLKNEQEVFVVLSAKCTLNNNDDKWSNAKYEGFFSTDEEAVQNIKSKPFF